jgi:hypothetical protein
MTSKSPATMHAGEGLAAVPLPPRAKGEADELRHHSNSELLRMAELHLVLGSADQVSPNVYRMLGVYRRIVRMWLEPHLHEGDPDTPCEGCDGQFTYTGCPQVALFRRMLVEFAAELLEPQS